MFSLTNSITFAVASTAIQEIRLMELPSSALVGVSAMIALMIGGLWIVQVILSLLIDRLAAWRGILMLLEDTVKQFFDIGMLVLSNCVVKITTWYSGDTWIGFVNVALAIFVLQAIQYKAPDTTKQA